jgi:hypothetical protein
LLLKVRKGSKIFSKKEDNIILLADPVKMLPARIVPVWSSTVKKVYFWLMKHKNIKVRL